MKVIVRRNVRYHREVLVLPEAFAVEHAVLADSGVCHALGSVTLRRRKRRIEFDLEKTIDRDGADDGVRQIGKAMTLWKTGGDSKHKHIASPLMNRRHRHFQ